MSDRILAFVLAGGRGTRLRPLTDEHAKPALPFAGGYRIVDFVLGNLFNSGVRSVYVLAHYKPRSLIEHLVGAWGYRSPPRDGRVLEVLLPAIESEPEGYRGTADAVYRNLHLVERHRPAQVAVFAADHVYRMDVRQMIDFHRRSDAEVTVSATPVPLRKAPAFGVIDAEASGRVREFHEKPERPTAIPGRPDEAYASMGNYLFEPDVLAAALREASERDEHDFGRDLIPRLVSTRRTYAYDFATNTVPGVRSYEERSYWRDVGTLEAFSNARHDVDGPAPRFELRNPRWPILGPREPAVRPLPDAPAWLDLRQ